MDRSSYQIINKKLNFDFQLRQFALLVLESSILVGVFLWLLNLQNNLVWLASIPLAILMFRSFAVMHEAVHGAIHPKNKKLNNLVGIVASAINFLPYDLWKTIHIDHHFWSGNFYKDPALEVVKQYPGSSKFMKFVFKAMWNSRFPLMTFFQYIVFWGHSIHRLKKKPRNLRFWLSSFLPILLWGGFLLSLNIKQITVVSIGLFLYGLFYDFINLPHHVGVYTYDEKTRTQIWDQHEVSRTCRYPSVIEHLVLNFNFHAEHHMYPTLPWHELTKAHDLLSEYRDDKNFHVINTGWLARQRSKDFSEFLRPDLYSDNNSKAA